jgi:hypothetical protein
MKYVMGFLKFVIGLILCQSLFGALFVVGWTWRLMQASTLKYWISLSSIEDHKPLPAPNWITTEGFFSKIKETKPAGYLKLFFGGFVSNLSVGIKSIFATSTLMLLPSLLWVFSWNLGWSHSFNKEYELSSVGASLGFLSIVIFIVFMFYLPMAQARLASSGRLRSFYDFGVIYRLVKEKYFSLLLLAGFYSLLSLPIMVSQIGPSFFGQPVLPGETSTLALKFSNLGELSAVEALDFIYGYYFWASTWMLLVFIFLHRMAARIYAAGVVSLLKQERLNIDDFADNEIEHLHALELAGPAIREQTHIAKRVASKTGNWLMRIGCGLAGFLLWFSFVAQIYVREFIFYHETTGWVNQPMIQLPCIVYVPDQLLEDAAQEEADS